jgi:hypothetical protein
MPQILKEECVQRRPHAKEPVRENTRCKCHETRCRKRPPGHFREYPRESKSPENVYDSQIGDAVRVRSSPGHAKYPSVTTQ